MSLRERKDEAISYKLLHSFLRDSHVASLLAYAKQQAPQNDISTTMKNDKTTFPKQSFTRVCSINQTHILF